MLALVIKNVMSVKLLGIYFDCKLTWSEQCVSSLHIDDVCKELSQATFLLVNIKKHVRVSYFKMSYFVYLESMLRYGLLIWGGGTGLDKILMKQKKLFD